MVDFERFTLKNGLKVLVHRDPTTPIVAMNLLYHVGAKDEDQEKTGFAHLFEHLMFEGSVNIPRFDEPLEAAGGQNNAFTSNDITNFYLTLPKQNLETAFWLESDRMMGLDLREEKVVIQKQVVIEEYKQRYLNQPYGDLWLLLRPLAFTVHPYRWPTIGSDISHIESASLEDVNGFFHKHYCPANAILTLAGDVDPQEIHKLAERWFGPVDRPYQYQRNLPKEPKQIAKRELAVHRRVPLHAVYKMFHSPARGEESYIFSDILSDILSHGDSSRLHQELVKKQQIFNDIYAFVTGETENGLCIIGGKVNPGISPEEAEKAIDRELVKLQQEVVDVKELEKVKNQMETSLKYTEMKALDKAMNLSMYEMMGDASRWQQETERILTVNPEQIRTAAQDIFTVENSSVLYYIADNNIS